jgi:hypothetical protein
MSKWYKRVVKDISVVSDALNYFENELVSASDETKLSGSLERHAQMLPGQIAYRFDQLQELEAILKYVNILHDRIRSIEYKNFTEHYNRDLNDRAINQYIDGQQDVVDMMILINDIALVRNKYLALNKALDQKGWLIGYITKLRCAGLENIFLESN